METATLQAAGGLGLFLFGMLMLTDGLKSATGTWLAAALRRFTRSPARGALTGAVATAVIQSSSATAVAAVGFVSAGILAFTQALGVIFGANVGTTMTGWLVAVFGLRFDVGGIAPLFVLLGALARVTGRPRLGTWGIALGGFGLVFVGIDVLSGAMAALEETLTPQSFPPDTWSGRLRLALLGVVITVVTQSSSAGVAAAITVVHAGAMTLPQAAALVVGMHVGTSATAALSTIGGSTQAKRTGWAHVIYNCITGVLAFGLIPAYVGLVDAWSGGDPSHPELLLVLFHSAFNVTAALIALPLTNRFAAFIERVIPEPADSMARRLDLSLLREPALAVAAAADVVGVLTARVLERASRSLIRLTSPSPSGPLAELKQAIAFLSELKTAPADGRVHDRHVGLMHVFDHLNRLDLRVRSRRLEGDQDTDVLDERARQLAQELAGMARRLRDKELTLDADAARRSAKALREFEKRYRRQMLQDAAAGAIDDPIALARLDEARRVSRIADHVRRIARHWNRAAAKVG